MLWELVHVFFDHRGLLTGREPRRTHDAGASSFLYPFLGEQESSLAPVLDDVRRSALMKSQEVGALRRQTLTDNRDALIAAAETLQDRVRHRRKAARARQRRLRDRRDGRRGGLPRAPAIPRST